MNVRLLRKVQKKIQDSPELFDMKDWDGKNECGTTHCIGGWGRALYRGRKSSMLDMFGIGLEQFTRLCNSCKWPKRFQGRKDPWKPTIKQAVARIDEFIATNGAE